MFHSLSIDHIESVTLMTYGLSCVTRRDLGGSSSTENQHQPGSI